MTADWHNIFVAIFNSWSQKFSMTTSWPPRPFPHLALSSFTLILQVQGCFIPFLFRNDCIPLFLDRRQMSNNVLTHGVRNLKWCFALPPLKQHLPFPPPSCLEFTVRKNDYIFKHRVWCTRIIYVLAKAFKTLSINACLKSKLCNIHTFCFRIDKLSLVLTDKWFFCNELFSNKTLP